MSLDIVRIVVLVVLLVVGLLLVAVCYRYVPVLYYVLGLVVATAIVLLLL